MDNFNFPQLCSNCQGYKTMPYSWNSTIAPRMCTCNIVSLAWECPRCKKVNAPWKGSCDCTPSPLSSATTSGTQPYHAGPITFNHYFIDPKGATTINHDSLNKNFTDK
jgi:hypothetical protein